MKAFSIFLILVGVLSFLSIFGMINVTFGTVVGVFFAILFLAEGVRELFRGNLVGIGGMLFGTFIFLKIFFLSVSAGQTFMAFIASYSIALGLHLMFKKRRFDFWKD